MPAAARGGSGHHSEGKNSVVAQQVANAHAIVIQTAHYSSWTRFPSWNGPSLTCIERPTMTRLATVSLQRRSRASLKTAVWQRRSDMCAALHISVQMKRSDT